ncbi:MAG: hypothetical protein IT337_06725, partial [Thermomicrobiales bacterium]|nr:hypothetical protein [Thermomicrobiales bacterium]
MDDSHFDALTRALTRSVSRRTGFGALAGGALALLGAVVADAKSKRRPPHGPRSGRGKPDADAARKHRKKRKGGNAACAKFCAQVFPKGQARDQCVRAATHKRGLCYQCGPQAPQGSGKIRCGQTCVAAGTDANCAKCGDACTGD